MIEHRFIEPPLPDPHWRENNQQRTRRFLEEQQQRQRRQDRLLRDRQFLAERVLVHRPRCKYTQFIIFYILF